MTFYQGEKVRGSSAGRLTRADEGERQTRSDLGMATQNRGL